MMQFYGIAMMELKRDSTLLSSDLSVAEILRLITMTFFRKGLGCGYSFDC